MISLSARQIRWSGWLLFAGALIMILVSLFGFLIPPPPLIVTAIINLLGGLLIALGFPATYLVQRSEIGPLGAIGFFLLWLASLATALTLSIAEAIIDITHLQTKAIPPTFTIILYLTSFLVLIGALLYGAQTIRVRIFPPSSGWFLIAAVAVNTLLLFIGGGIVPFLYILWALFLQIGLARFGFALGRLPDESDFEPTELEEATTSDIP